MASAPRTHENAETILSFEAFVAPTHLGTPTFNNFYLFFAEGIFGNLYRSKPEACYAAFAKKEPGLEQTLYKGVSEAIAEQKEAETQGTYPSIVPLLEKRSLLEPLYEAYVAMRRLGADDEALFR
jgi:hypothetical protein